MNILLLGANGQLGRELVASLGSLGQLDARSRAGLDLSDLDTLAWVIRDLRPHLIVNAAAYTAVDQAESEPEQAHRVNAAAVAVIGEEAKRCGAALIHYSTDFVFDGKKADSYTEDDPTNPLGMYGRSKLAGEVALQELDAPAVVLRTAWVYGLRTKSFVNTMLKLARERAELRAVTDQVGSPTWAVDLAQATRRLIEWAGTNAPGALRDARGIYHAAGGGACSRFELTQALLELDPGRAHQVVRSLIPATSTDFPAPAPRPSFAPLDCTRLADRFGVRLRPWRDALALALARG